LRVSGFTAEAEKAERGIGAEALSDQISRRSLLDRFSGAPPRSTFRIQRRRSRPANLASADWRRRGTRRDQRFPAINTVEGPAMPQNPVINNFVRR
jgi:hypothetical protein